MSLFDYRESRELAATDPSFAALIMAAYRKADTYNEVKIRAAWPEIVGELQARYDAKGGLLAGETAPEELRIPDPDPDGDL